MHHGVRVRVVFRRASEHTETTAAAAAHLGVMSYMFSLIFVLVTFLRVLYNNIHHHVAFARELEEKEKNTEQDQPAVRFIFQLVICLLYTSPSPRDS